MFVNKFKRRRVSRRKRIGS